jgi:hypothetical protein
MLVPIENLKRKKKKKVFLIKNKKIKCLSPIGMVAKKR